MAVSNIPAAAGGGGLEPKYQKFTSSGTFTLPTGYGAGKPLLVNIQVIGGGGGGVGPFVTNNTGTLGNYKFSAYFGGGGNWTVNGSTINRSTANTDGQAGGSGGIAATQLYLTANLSITVGAAGARPDVTQTYAYTVSNAVVTNGHDGGFAIVYTSPSLTGGTGGTSTAGAISATGGNGATGTAIIRSDQNLNQNNNGTATTVDGGTYAHGTGGTPAGTAGAATPLLGTLAGGSGTATSVKGSFGVGGIKTDGATHSGVDGTGGGFGSIGASGAVILTWWE